MPSTTPLRVLFVEDEPTIAIPLADDMLDCGLDVTVAGDGATALDRLSTGRFDAVISDLRLPGTSGIDVLRSARGRLPTARLLLLTAYAEPCHRDALRELHGGLMLKPFANDDVLGWLRTVRAG